MKYTQTLLKTSKETPAGEDSKNAQLLIRGGFVKKEMAGVYSYLPLGLKVLRKIENVVRTEMDNVGCAELLMPSLSKKENWEKTGRWDMPILYKMEMTTGTEVALHPTHEETVTPLTQQFCASPKDFPKGVYQIQNKFRNEPRAKSGLLRGREFLMKDAYSFHLTQECFEEYYAVMTNAYHRIFMGLGLGEITKIVAASGGDFSEFSHEFQTLCEIGEDEIFYIKSEDRYLNREVTPSKAPDPKNPNIEMKPMEEVFGEGIIGVEDLCKHLNVSIDQPTKTILFENEKGEVIAAAIRGTYEIDTHKLKKIVGCKSLELASEETVKRVTGAGVGYAGMLNLSADVKSFWDDSCAGRINFEMGANKTNYHNINVNFGRDIDNPEQFYDFKVAKKGDFYPKTGEKYEVFNAIEVGNIFPLGNKFSSSFNFKIDGKALIMGCYGIGISRLMGAVAEIFSDDKGLKWPKHLAPFQVYLAPIGKSDEAYEAADKLYEELKSVGIETLYDDRREKKVGPGQKFGDHELLGIPYRVVISERTLEEGMVELVSRADGEMKKVRVEDVVSVLKK